MRDLEDNIERIHARKDAENEYNKINDLADTEEFNKKVEEIKEGIRYSDNSWNYKEAYYEWIDFLGRFFYKGGKK